MLRKLRIYLINHFGFSKTESNGVIILFLIVICVSILPHLFLTHQLRHHVPDTTIRLTDWNKKVASSIAPRSTEHRDEPQRTTSRPGESFPFDPNDASSKDLIRLGFKPYIAQRIINYRNSGGTFKARSDLLKIYGIDSGTVKRLDTYIRIPQPPPAPAEKAPLTDVIEAPPGKTDLNIASEDELMLIRGIGPVLSARIVKFRTSVGGFYSFDQLREVYHLHDSLLPAIKERFELNTTALAKLHVNTDSIRSLIRHPYVPYNLARAIVNYREVHGPFERVEDLRNIHILHDSTFNRIYPYIALEGSK